MGDTLAKIIFTVGIPIYLVWTSYFPIRLYLTGDYHSDVITFVEIKETYMTSPTLGQYVIRYAEVSLRAYPKTLASSTLSLQVGQQVTLLVSPRLQMEVLLPQETGLLAVLYAGGGVFQVVQTLLLAVILAIGLLVRFYFLLRHFLSRAQIWWRSNYQPSLSLLKRMVVISNFASLLTTLAITFILILSVLYLLVLGILLVEQAGLILTTILIVFSLILIFSPLAERTADLMLAIKEARIWTELLTIGRNVLAIISGGVLVWKILQFLGQGDARNYTNIQSLLGSFLSFLLS